MRCDLAHICRAGTTASTTTGLQDSLTMADLTPVSSSSSASASSSSASAWALPLCADAVADADADAGTGPPSFLLDTYNMVDDPCTDTVVCWSSSNDSFVVWDSLALSADLLPRLFKQDKLSSFVRHLNAYGFRKVDPNRWEFASEGFVRGHKHLLEDIQRRRSSLLAPPQSPEQQVVGVGDLCIQLGRDAGMHSEIERLKRDNSLLMVELVGLRGQHLLTTKRDMGAIQYLMETKELRQQQMIAFLTKGTRKPTFMTQLGIGSRKHLRNAKIKCFSDVEEPGSSSSIVPVDRPRIKLPSSDPCKVLEALLQEMEQRQLDYDAETLLRGGALPLPWSQAGGMPTIDQRTGINELGKWQPLFEERETRRGRCGHNRSVLGVDDVFWELLVAADNADCEKHDALVHNPCGLYAVTSTS